MTSQPESTATTVALASEATNEFALRLYPELARESLGRNVFYSPYSITTALTLAALGARGETAEQMGTALAFPARLHREDSEDPWDTARVMRGFAAIAAGLAPEDAAHVEAVRAEIAALRTKVDAAQREVERLQEAGDWAAYQKKVESANALADQLDEKLAQVDQYEIHVANSLWCEQTYPFRKSYLETVRAVDPSVGVFPVDFRHAFEQARVRINDWVAEQTRDRITDLVPAGVLDEFTRLVLTNAIYFKGEWAEPFDAEKTKQGPFTRIDGSEVPADLMNAPSLEQASYAAFTADGSYFETPRQITRGQTTGLYPEDDGFLVVDLPYKGDRLSMLAIVPRAVDGLDRLERMLTAEMLDAWLRRLDAREVNVTLPRFELETEYSLADALKAMGMIRAFLDPTELDGADFSAMSQATDRSEWLYITAVLHKAFLEVNEKGTEAAAATAVVMARATSVSITEPFVPTVRADHPFLFLIRDRENGTILFLGRFVGP